MSLPSFSILQNLFSNEEACLSFLFNKGIFYKSRACPTCQLNMTLYMNKKLFICPKRGCRRALSIKKGSFFAGHNLPCSKILFMAYLWLSKVSSSSIVSMTGHSNKTVGNFLHYFRQLVSSHLDEEDTMVGGPGVIVEIDESKFGKRKHHRGHSVEGVWVVGGVERTSERKAFVIPVLDRSSNTLLDIIARHVLPGSIVYTDLWGGYIGISSALGLEHQTVNHSQYFTDPVTGVNTNTIEGTWNGLEMCIAPKNRTRQSIEEHVLEFIWRRKHARTTWDSFISALSEISYDE